MKCLIPCLALLMMFAISCERQESVGSLVYEAKKDAGAHGVVVEIALEPYANIDVGLFAEAARKSIVEKMQDAGFKVRASAVGNGTVLVDLDGLTKKGYLGKGASMPKKFEPSPARFSVSNVHRDSDVIVKGILRADGRLNSARVRELYSEGLRVCPLTTPAGDSWVVVEIGSIVERAQFVSFKREGAGVIVTLTKAGAEQMRDATAGMRYGSDRVAFRFHGKVLSAPVVQAEMGRQFLIATGSEAEAEKLATQMMFQLGGFVSVGKAIEY